MMKRNYSLNVSDIPVLCPNVPDYRAEAFEQAREQSNTFGCAFVLYNGLYYHVTSSRDTVEQWKRKGYKVIHRFVSVMPIE